MCNKYKNKETIEIQKDMVIEKIGNEKIVMTFQNKIDAFDIQSLIDYARYLEATAHSHARQPDVDALADEVSRNWWNSNKHRFLKCE
jgi:hypothetical protein